MDFFRSFRLLSLIAAMGLLPAPTSWANNAMPWDAREDERDAQEEELYAEQMSQQEMSSSIYGRITSISQRQKVLYLLPTDDIENEEAEEEIGATAEAYRFKTDTHLTGLDELKELAPGDYVTLEYYDFQDSHWITEIAFDKHGGKEGTSEDTGEAASSEAREGVLVG